MIKRMIRTAELAGFVLGLLLGLGATAVHAAEGDPTQWVAVAGDPSQW
ncbi:hypothetical protein [Nonomuraea sp. SYSU D8015]|nr:hypothetical protein [Nonomuraea sp. SYSU D8015]